MFDESPRCVLLEVRQRISVSTLGFIRVLPNGNALGRGVLGNVRKNPDVSACARIFALFSSELVF